MNNNVITISSKTRTSNSCELKFSEKPFSPSGGLDYRNALKYIK